MLDTLFRRSNLIARLDAGLFAPYLRPLASSLLEQGYSTASIQSYIRAVDAFGHWLSRNGRTLADLDEDLLVQYIAGLGRRISTTSTRGRLPKAAVGLGHLLDHLRQADAIQKAPIREPRTPVEVFLQGYSEHLEFVQGVAPATRKKYLFDARLLLTPCFGKGPVDWTSLTAGRISAFVQDRAAALRQHGRKSPGVAVRSLLRYLVGRGDVRAGLDAAVPTIRTWKHAALPKHATSDDIDRLLGACDLATPTGLRDRAIVLLLARLGMRAKEVITLELGDLVWTEGILVVRAGKTHRERRLPLSREVGEGIAMYLKQARPRTAHQAVFLSSMPPFAPLMSSSAVTHIVPRLAVRSGVDLPTPGAHALRHTAATQMVRRGASFKDVADVLGHRSLDTTAIYAKLDTESLARVALPWPGGAR